MAFVKYTAPPPPPPPAPKPKPHVKFVRSIIQFTEDGWAHIGQIASKLHDSSHVHLWHDPQTSQVAVTPAAAGDPDAFPVKDGKIQAKKFLDFAKIPVPVKEHSKTLEAHDDGVKFTIGPKAATTTGSKPKKAPWKPGDPIPTRGRKSAAQLAW